MKQPQREEWGSRFGFVMASVGGAVGLGNIWRFPSEVAENGGGIFLLLYLIVVLSIGISLFIGETTLGYAGKRNTVGVLKKLSPGSPWWVIGLLPVVISYLVLSFYSVVAGWVLLYTFSSASGSLAGLSAQSLETLFVSLSTQPVYPLLAQAIIMGLSATFLSLGVKKGLEKLNSILMPGMMIALVVLLIRTVLLENYLSGFWWFIKPNWELLTMNTALKAIGQAFFSLSLGMGILVVFGSYLPRKTNIVKNSTIICLADLGVACLTGLIVIPAIFVFGVGLDSGPGLVFITLPAIFNTLPLGSLWNFIIFILLIFASFTSIIAMLEVINAYLIDTLKISRIQATIAGSLGVFLMSILASFSLGIWQDYTLLGRHFFDFLSFLSTNLLLPVGGLLLTVYLGWVWGSKSILKTIGFTGFSFSWAGAWSLLIRFIAPPALAYIIYSSLIRR